MPIKKTEFYVSKYTDTDLQTLLKTVQDEIQRREEMRKHQREEWIQDLYWRFVNHPNAVAHQVGEVTVVAVYHRNCGQRIATARPVNGDKFECNAGIAVAYAKAVGERIPSFI